MGKSLAARSALLLTAGVTAFGASVVPALAGPGSSPPGNNGTVKIDGEAFDDHPNNEPHVGCTFQVDFYGYDKGDLDATVTFEAHPPTTREDGDQVLLEDTVFIGEDDASGGGSEAGLDASETYTLDFAGIEPHPQQGFHVKLTIHAEGSQGADVKHKVFWVKCAETPTPTPTKTSPTATKTPTAKPTKTSPTATKTPTAKPTKTTPPPKVKPTHTPTEKPTQRPKPSTESPAVVPTSVPAGSEGPGANTALAYLGLATASGAAAVGGALYRRRHNV